MSEPGMDERKPGTIDESEIEMADLLEIRLGDRSVLARAGDVAEVVRPVPLTPVPMGPEHLLGLANIHGQVVCIIEAGKVVRLPESSPEDTPYTRYVVLRHPRMHVGIRVDGVPAIHRVPAASLPEDRAPEDEAGYAAGTIEIEGKSYELLHVPSLLH